MDVLKCPQCGAPVHPPAGATLHVCEYCQTSIELARPAPPPAIQIVIQGPGSGDLTGLAPQIQRSVQRSIQLAVIGSIALTLVITGVVVATTVRSSSSSMRPALLAAAAWDGTTPLSCAGNDDLTVSDKTASFTSGTAIFAAGNCHLTLKNCALKGTTAVVASGNARLTLIGGSVEGSAAAIEASGNATVELGGARVTGAVKKRGNATVR